MMLPTRRLSFNYFTHSLSSGVQMILSHTFLDLQLLQASRKYVGPARSTENEFSL